MTTRARNRSSSIARRSSLSRSPRVDLTVKQTRFLDSTAKVSLFRGAIASGKTIAGAAKSIERRYRYPGTGELIGGPSWDQVRDGAMVTLRRLLNPSCIVYENKNEHVWELDNGSWFQFRSLAEPDVMRSLEMHDVWIDEIAMCQQRALDVALGRIRLPYGDPTFEHQAWGTTTPRAMDWTLDVFGWEGKSSQFAVTDELGNATGEKVEIRYGVTHSTIFDNRANLPLGYIEQLQQRYQGTPFYEQELLGMYTAFEGLVYSMYRRETHVAGLPCELKSCKRVVVGVDFGGATPTAMELVGERASGRLYDFAEFYRIGATIPQMIEKLHEWQKLLGRPIDIVACDGSEPVAIATIKAAGFNAVAADKDRDTGIKLVQQRLGPAAGGPGLQFSAECTGILSEILMYVWQSRKDGATKIVRLTDQPIDHHGDALDACVRRGSLVATERGDVPIEQIRPGERVWTRKGLRDVSATGMTNPAARVMTMRMSDGGSLIATPNHPVWVVGQGFTRLDALRYGDILHSCPESMPRPTESARSSSMASHTDGGSGGRTRTTTPTQAIVNTASRRFTKRSGRRRTGPSHPATTFTTRIATPRTTRSLTSSALLARSTGLSTRKTHCPSAAWLTSLRSDTWPQRGTQRRKGGHGTARTGRRAGQRAMRLTRSVVNVGRPTKRSTGPTWFGSALTHVGRNGAGRPGWITRRGAAPPAPRTSSRISTASSDSALVYVLGVSAENEREPVYNLTVEGQPEYFANGVLVHNCRYAVMALGQLVERKIIVLPSGRRVVGTARALPAPDVRRSPLDRPLPKVRPTAA